ncbi:MAG: ATP-binding cassette domain-containing protein [Planctomycetes bacterium]|nr:ATP-binding cassette domain-containing protein [Planctomycetota bacterium]
MSIKSEQTVTPIVELQQVSHFVVKKPLVADIDWRIDPSMHWAILGPNGAGKTTLLKIICGYLWPNGGGRVLREGQEFVDLSLWRRQVGWLTAQLTTQVPASERVCDTVLSGRWAQLGLKRFPGWEESADVERQSQAALETVGCAELAERTFGTLSQGEQQKVLIARASMARRKLLILDEPCAGLDPAARESLLEAIERLGRRPEAPAMLMVTHHVEEIMPVFSQTLVLRNARVLAAGPTAEIVDAKLLGELYGRPISRLIESGGRFWPVW